MTLKALLAQCNLVQAHVARELGISAGTFADIVNHDKWPVKNHSDLKNKLGDLLMHAGATTQQIVCALSPAPTTDVNTAKKQKAQATTLEPFETTFKNVPKTTRHANDALTLKESTDMLLRKQTITQAARKSFNLFRDPFLDDVNEAADVYLSNDIRYVRESMWAVAKHGGMLAVVGESGAGKTTLRRDLIDRIARENANVIVVEPYVLAMEENDMKGKTLKSANIADAIIHAINPLINVKRSSEARFRQLHKLLIDSNRSGNKHLLIIEEAHCLPTATLKHLKRFFELEDGFKKLLGIVLVGQPELRLKLSEKNAEVREVVQRCEIAELSPLDNQLADYLDFKLRRVGSELDKVFDKGAVDAIRAKLTFNQSASRGLRGEGHQVSLLYPLAVANLVSAAINSAVEIGAPLVSADIVKEI